MRVALYEDGSAGDLGPIALMRPVFELVCGRFTLRERLLRHFGAREWSAFVRDYLAETYREEFPEASVNDFVRLTRAPTVLVNGRWLPTPEALPAIREDEVGVIDDTVAYLTLDPLEAVLLTETSWDDALAQIARTRRFVPAAGQLIHRPWDLIEHNPAQLASDFRWLKDSLPRSEPGPQVATLGPVENVSIDPSAEIDPFVVLDARHGPVTIDAGARIQAFTRLEGPCHVGRQSHLFRANIREGTTIGPVCRVGGEIEESILHGYVNKYHDGFLGHSYVCPWVNLGALTTNSDLKNDYSSVSVPLAGEAIDSGSTKVGCFIGDHTKTAIGSLFNTGSSVGIMCLVLPGGELLPKHVPSFARVWHGELVDAWDLGRSLETARAAMSRRGMELTPAQERLIRYHFEAASEERAVAIHRTREKAPRPAFAGSER
ncbi:MAG: putative sugar nucleotidyl transferase [Planctomycetales bacterium]